MCIMIIILIRAFQGAAMSVRSSPLESRKRLGRDVLDTFAPRDGFVDDVTDTAGHKMDALMVVVFCATLKRRFLTTRTTAVCGVLLLVLLLIIIISIIIIIKRTR